MVEQSRSPSSQAIDVYHGILAVWQ